MAVGRSSSFVEASDPNSIAGPPSAPDGEGAETTRSVSVCDSGAVVDGSAGLILGDKVPKPPCLFVDEESLAVPFLRITVTSGTLGCWGFRPEMSPTF